MSDRQLGEQFRLNILEWVNYDPYLSEFKHHFILHRVHIPQLQFNQFSCNLYRLFRANLSPTSIYVIQIIQTYDNFFYDVAVGFRRDSEALNIFEKNRKVYISGKEVEIQLSEAFRIYADSKQISLKKSDRRRKSHSNSSFSASDHRRRRKDSNRRSRSRSQSSSSRSRSPSISLRSQRNKDSFKSSFCLPLLPYQWGKEYLQSKLCEQLKCYRSDLSIEDKRGEFSSMIVTVRSQSAYNELLNGARIGDYSLLVMRLDDVDKNGLKVELKKYQFKAQRNEPASLQTAFDELATFLLNFKEFHLKVVMITCLQNFFLVTTQTRISSVLKFLKLSGWRFEAANFALRLNPSLQDRWFTYLKNRTY